ncbi:hypothetical protein [Pontibacter chitinilyticus]|uniref:hypothetical protein n=1 Tax=Pontibacter chitinilyticus TaxID=2674989 RepID=UPI003219F00E
MESDTETYDNVQDAELNLADATTSDCLSHLKYNAGRKQKTARAVTILPWFCYLHQKQQNNRIDKPTLL